ncbi:bifunctional UDP-N-acetylglucosamine diphosphorylase/glucosamine-1-phosphate N-acetyltransferase GlmU [Terrarubrum flagellatum]|uniref:bifunctional UDP-N-acetylglucosamine diphosphorylase/glucosamine-1-phosphate N-acetyltransferase GlmU n=1 Tax=Terrirubrum flagellatum TaxID=2895980 RepID=UPI0031456EC6
MSDAGREALAIVLAAGEGTRMRSRTPKVLHRIAGRSMLGHALATIAEAGIGRVAVVVGPGHDAVAAEARAISPGAEIFVQQERLGTGHAVMAARAAVTGDVGEVLIIYADTPFVSVETLRGMRATVAEGAAVVGVGFEAKDPTGYGRFLMKDRRLTAIREHRDATDAERKVTLCNAGLMAFRGRDLPDLLDSLTDTNDQKQFYLTDAAEIAHAKGLVVNAITCGEDEVLGVNDRAQLAAAEAVMQQRLREKVMREGATLIAPDTVFLSFDTKIGQDVMIEPHVVFGPGVVVENDVVIHSFSHLEGAHVGRGASIGPFGRLRPGAKLGEKSRIGNFVEVKNADIGAGAKANHLAYIGDASVGAESNIGAGAVFCNYDGVNKHHTEVGAGAFIGTNVTLVAPVKVGDGAFVAAGSTITRNVPDDALAIGRGRQEMREGWAAARRQRYPAKKKDH